MNSRKSHKMEPLRLKAHFCMVFRWYCLILNLDRVNVCVETRSPLFTTIVVLIRLISRPNHCYQWLLGMKCVLNPLTAKWFNLNFHPLEVVSRWRYPQLQVSENYSDLTKWSSTLFKSCWLMSHFKMLVDTTYLKCGT